MKKLWMLLIVVFLMLFGVVPYSSEVLTAFLIGAGLLVVGQTINCNMLV